MTGGTKALPEPVLTGSVDFTSIPKLLFCLMSLKIICLEILLHFLGVIELKVKLHI